MIVDRKRWPKRGREQIMQIIIIDYSYVMLSWLCTICIITVYFRNKAIFVKMRLPPNKNLLKSVYLEWAR